MKKQTGLEKVRALKSRAMALLERSITRGDFCLTEERRIYVRARKMKGRGMAFYRGLLRLFDAQLGFIREGIPGEAGFFDLYSSDEPWALSYFEALLKRVRKFQRSEAECGAIIARLLVLVAMKMCDWHERETLKPRM